MQYHSATINEEKFRIAREIIQSQKETPIAEYYKIDTLKSIKGERWKNIKLEYFSEFYLVSNYGRLKRLFRYVGYRNGTPKKWIEKILVPKVSTENRLQSRLYVNKVSRYIPPHQFVMAAFSNKKNVYNCINHIDGNPLNNHFLNLEYCTLSYNELHSFHVLGKKPNSKGKLLTDNHFCKGAIAQYSLSGQLIRTFTCREETRVHGFQPAHVVAVINGRRKTHANSLWKILKQQDA